jgi:predicted transcriptional regulator
MTDQLRSPNSIKLAAEIVSAFVSNNSVTTAELPALITHVHGALENLGKPAQPEPEKLIPLMPVKKTITSAFLISLEDGRRYKSLRRHLAGRGLTPEQYRQKWGLPHDYPMVSPNYSAQRSELARSMGLGQQRKGTTKMAAKSASTSAKVTGEAPKRRGRTKAG